jgi:PleD family two-component response regulator
LAQPVDQASTVEHHCSASIGMVLFFKQEASPDDIMKWADAAMYRAKASGRNQIRWHANGNQALPTDCRH